MRYLILVMTLLCFAGSAQAQAPCSNLTGTARTNCLNAAQQQAQQRAQQAAQLAQQQAQQRAQQAAQLAQQQAQQRVGNPAICPKLTGAARTNCLNAELQRSQQESARAEQKVRNLDRAIGVMEPADKVLGVVGAGAALGAGALAGGPKGAMSAYELYGGYREFAPIAVPAIGNAIGNSVKPCPGKGNSGVAGTTPERC